MAKHCVPAVPSKRYFKKMTSSFFLSQFVANLWCLSLLFYRISITFRRMDESKRPFGYTPEPDLQGLRPLPDEKHDRPSNRNASRESRPKHSSIRSVGYSPEPDFQGLQSLPDEEHDRSSNHNASRESGPRRPSRRPSLGREDNRTDQGRGLFSENSSPRSSGRTRLGPPSRRRFQSTVEN